MLEIQGLRNKINSIETELKEVKADTLYSTALIFRVRVNIAKLEAGIGLLEKELQEIRELRKGA